MSRLPRIAWLLLWLSAFFASPHQLSGSDQRLGTTAIVGWSPNEIVLGVDGKTTSVRNGEVVGSMTDLTALQMRSYINEPDRGRRNWCGKRRQQQAVYGNRRRMRGERGKQLSRLRSERVERSFAHLYETGRMRRTHLRGHENILKRLLIHGGAFNLSLLLRKELGAGTPRGLAEAKKAFDWLWEAVRRLLSARRTRWFRLWPRPANGSFRLDSPLCVFRLARAA